MNFHVAIAIFFVAFFLSNHLLAESAKILGIFSVRSKSHHSVHEPILNGLANKGHEVTIIGHFKYNVNVSNYKEILISEFEKVSNWVDCITVEDRTNYVGVQKWLMVSYAIEQPKCEKIFRFDYIKQLIKSSTDHPIDLIIAEVYHIRCFHLLAHKLNVPLILILPPSSEIGNDYFVGNPFVPSITPLRNTMFTTKMNFWQRFENLFQYGLTYWYHNIIQNKDMERYAREIFNMTLPSDEELNRKTALAFYNNHPSFISRPKSPNVIDIAGIHIKEAKKITKEEFIEGAPNGVILFSFGTTIKVSSMGSEKLKAITDALSVIPQRVLWRVNYLNITDVSPNVKLGTWFPQRDILEHKKVIAFISHCGLLGTLEAIYTTTPVIGVPFMLDQFQNANILVERGVGIYVDYFSMNKESLIEAIEEITKNNKYRENIIKWSKIIQDRPMSHLDEALYWTEYVLKHQGAPHLRTAAADMPLYQYLLLDVLASILAIVLGFMYFLKLIFKCLISLMWQQKPKKNKIQ